VRSLISIPAGAAKMQMGSFLLLTAAGTAIWNTVLVFLGKFAGDAWVNIANYVNVYSIIAVGVFGVITIVVGMIFIKKRFLSPRGTARKTR